MNITVFLPDQVWRRRTACSGPAPDPMLAQMFRPFSELRQSVPPWKLARMLQGDPYGPIKKPHIIYHRPTKVS